MASNSNDNNTRKMLHVKLLKIIDPVRFFLREATSEHMSDDLREFLNLEQHVLKHVDKYDIIPEKYTLPPNGSLVIVKPEIGKMWCRGQVQCILETTKGAQVNVFLVDHGKVVTVHPKLIRSMQASMYEVPFQAFEFVLLGLRPLSLTIQEDVTLKRMPSDRWDTSTIKFINDFFDTENVVIEIMCQDDRGRCHGNLYSPNKEKSLNERLVSNDYAWFDAKLGTKDLSNAEADVHVDVKDRTKLEMALKNTASVTSPKVALARSAPFVKQNIPPAGLSFSLLQPINSVLSHSHAQALNPAVMSSSPKSQSGGVDDDKKIGIGRGMLLKKLMETNKRTSTVNPVGLGRGAILAEAFGLKEHPPPKAKEQQSQSEDSIGQFMRRMSILKDIRKGTDSNSSKSNCDYDPKTASPSEKKDCFVEYELNSRCSSACSTKSSFSAVEKYLSMNKVTVTRHFERDIEVIQREPNRGLSPQWEKLASKYTKRIDCRSVDSKLSSSALELKPLPPNFVHAVTPETFEHSVDCTSENSTPILESSKCNMDKTPERSTPKPRKNGVESRERFILKSPQNKPLDLVEPATPTNFDSQNTFKSSIIERVKQAGIQSFLQPQSVQEKKLLDENLGFNKDYSMIEALYTTNSKDCVVGIITLGNNIPKPNSTLEEFGFEPSILQTMKRALIKTPSVIQSNMWPAVLRGRCCVCVGLKNSGKSLGYIIPVLDQLLQVGNYEDLPNGPGPLVIVLCANWNVCQRVHEQFETFAPQYGINHIKVITIHGGDTIEMKLVELLRGCDVLVTTPSMLMKIIKNKMGIEVIDRCCHLLCEESDELIETFIAEMLEAVREYSKAMVRRGKDSSCVNQIIICSATWSKGVQSFVKLMPSPLLYFSNFLEAAIQAEIPFYVHVCKSYKESGAIFEILEKSGSSNVIICATNHKSVEILEKVLKANSNNCLAAHEGMVLYELDTIREQWKISSATSNSPILVVSDAVFNEMGITNAECLIHFDVPDVSKLQFSNRFSCLKEAIIERGNINTSRSKRKKSILKECICHVILSQENSLQSYELKRIMRRLKCHIPKALTNLAQKELLKRELCPNLLAFGKCDVSEFCRLRHTVCGTIDQPNGTLPHWGVVKLLVTHVIHASFYYGNILEFKDPNTGESVSTHRENYIEMNIKLLDHFQKSRIQEMVSQPHAGDLCIIKGVGGTVYRVKITYVHPVALSYVKKVDVFAIDQGWTRTMQWDQLYKLPNWCQSLPPQVVAIRLCKVKPVDRSNLWTIQADTFVNNMIKGKELQGKVALSLSNCVFVTNLEPKQSNSYDLSLSVAMKLKAENLAVTNSNHIDSLRNISNDVISWTQEPLEVKKVNLTAIARKESLKLNTTYEVFVTSVQLPSLFYAIPHQNYKQLCDLNDLINELLGEGKLTRVDRVRKNSLVLGPFEDEQKWFRARVTEVVEGSQNFVRLFFPDFGDEGNALMQDIYKMPASIMEALPFQAMECSLNGIQAAHGGWTENAIDIFALMTKEEDDDSLYRKLLLKPIQESAAVTSDGNHYTVELCNENNVSLALELIKQGLAEDIKQVQLTNSQNDAAESEESSDEELNRKQTEVATNFSLGLSGFDEHQTEKFRGYAINANCATDPNVTCKPHKIISSSPKVASDSKKGTAIESCLALKLKNPDKMPPLEVSNEVIRTVPKTSWFQTKEFVVIQFEIESCSEYFLQIGPSSISFQAIHGNKFFEFNEDLYSIILPETSTSIPLPQRVKLRLLKSIEGAKWPRLLSSTKSVPNLTLHLDHCDEDSDEVENVPKVPDHSPTPRSKGEDYVRDVDDYSSTSSDNEESLNDQD